MLKEIATNGKTSKRKTRYKFRVILLCNYAYTFTHFLHVYVYIYSDELNFYRLWDN